MIKAIKRRDGLISFQADHFDLKQTLDCGQSFRWDTVEDDHYVGVAKGRVLELKQVDNEILALNTSEAELYDVWIDYFDLNRDYGEILNSIANDQIISEAVKYGYGMRILNQDEWETIVSFIISANNNIPRIKKIIGQFCKSFGDKIEYNGNYYYTFPSPKQLEGIKEEDLREIKSGYRAKYIVDAVEKVNSGEVDLYNLKNLDTSTARKELQKIKGVGPKVSDCILLYSMRKFECYPIDVWIKKVTERLYLKRESTAEEIHQFAKDLWGEYAGFAQQYLFHYARNNL